MTQGFDERTQRAMAAIAANWDARTPIHRASRFYDREAESWFAAYEWADLGDLTGRDVLHLQCHLGTETAAFARRGARSVTGLDVSGAAIEAARELNPGISYVRANVYDAVEALGGRRFDVVYTGKGSLVYLPDLDRWAETVAALLNPGGTFYLVEFHPLLAALGTVPGPDDDGLVLRHDYLEGRGPVERDASRTYTDGPPVTGATISHEWAHGLGEVVTAVVRAGLTVRGLREIEEIPWPRWPQMVSTAGGFFRLPGDQPRIPLFYALRATRAE